MPTHPVPPLFTLAQGLELILASTSPRRKQFLSEWGVPFKSVNASAEEPRPHAGEPPESYACRAAAAKAHAVAGELAMATAESQPKRLLRSKAKIILSADTIVAMDGDILGKPEHPEHALLMLKRLNGRGHEVISAVCLLLPFWENQAGDTATAWASDSIVSPALPTLHVSESRYETYRQLLFYDTSRVFFHSWPLAVLEAYARTGEPNDKAGAYAIQGQGAMLVERLEGSWSTVVGLPVTLLAHLLLHLGVLMPTSDGTKQVR